QSERGQSADLLDDGNLLLAGRFEDDVEFGLLFSGFLSASGGRGSGDGGGGRSGSLDVEFLFELLDELGEFDEGELLASFDELVAGELSHGGSSSLSCSRFVTGFVGCDAQVLRSCSVVLLLAESIDSARGLDQRSGEEVSRLVEASLHGTGSLCKQHFAGFEVGELVDLLGAECGSIEVAALDHELGVRLGKVTQSLGSLGRFAVDERDRGGPIEVLIETGDSGFLGCNLGQRVLYHGVADVLTERDAQLFQLRDGETAVLGQQHSVGVLKPLFDLLDCGCLVWPRHGVPFISRPVRPDTQKKRSTQEGVKRLTPDSERKPAEVS